jgi:hypothetical protein
MTTPQIRARRGFTILEMLISMSLMLAIIGMSTQLFRKQSGAVSQQAGRLDAQQNSRFALSMVERELRVAGVGVVDKQPLLVMGARTAITFNANLVSLDTGDLGSVYINADADSAATNVLRKEDKYKLPTTSTWYPESTYMANTGVTSNAETISYWLSADSSVSYPNEYVLWRKVNALAPRMVARGIYYNPSTDTLFHYYKPDSLGYMREISTALLPIIHTAPIHGTQGDTAKSALTDSVKQVRAVFTSVFHDTRNNTTTYRTQNLTIKLMNAGLIHHVTCGNPPIPVSSLTATVTPANGTTILQPYVTLTWTNATDDGAGEKDVERYAVYRRLSSATTFDQPIGSIVAGHSSYSFQDADVLSGQQLVYGVAALDCSPALSSMTTTASSVTIP